MCRRKLKKLGEKKEYVEERFSLVCLREKKLDEKKKKE